MKRLCQDCGEILKGRSDKKFCHDQCRVSYHNATNSIENKHIRTINVILKRNRQILERLNPSGKIKISYTQLLHSGFDQNFHTHFFQTKRGDEYLFCYDHGYLKLDNDLVLLVKKIEK